MQRGLLLLAVLALAVPASAAPGHGTVSSDETMYIHFLSDRLALQPATPVSSTLSEVTLAAPACGEIHRWQAGFTRGVPDATGSAADKPDLARNVTFDKSTNPSVRWYIETVNPVTGEPMPLPANGANMTVELRTGTDLVTWQDGELLASAAGSVSLSAVAAGERNVYSFIARPAWVEAITLDAGDTLQLEVSLRFLSDECPLSWPGLRAYSSSEAQPRIEWRIYDPIRIEAITATPQGDDIIIRVIAASPWGSSRIAPIEAPAIAGGSGQSGAIEPIGYEDEGIVNATWKWSPGGAPNGTYRADIKLATPQGDYSIDDFVVFRLGAPPGQGPAPTPTPQSKDTPFPGAMALVALAGVALLRRR